MITPFLVACATSCALGCIIHAAWSDYRAKRDRAKRYAILRRRPVLRRF